MDRTDPQEPTTTADTPAPEPAPGEVSGVPGPAPEPAPGEALGVPEPTHSSPGLNTPDGGGQAPPDAPDEEGPPHRAPTRAEPATGPAGATPPGPAGARGADEEVSPESSPGGDSQPGPPTRAAVVTGGAGPAGSVVTGGAGPAGSVVTGGADPAGSVGAAGPDAAGGAASRKEPAEATPSGAAGVKDDGDGQASPPGPPGVSGSGRAKGRPPGPAGASGTGEDAPPGEPAGGASPAVPGGHAGKRRRPWVRRVRRTALVLVLLLIVPVLAVETALRINYTGDPAEGTYTRDRDAMWLGHAWVDGRKKDADVTALARRLEGTGIRDLYVHSGPLEHDGTLPKSAYPRARWFIDAVHRELPGVRVQAFLGDILANGGPEGLHLDRAATRAEVVRSAGQVLDTGYDGVHLDLEPLHSGDRDYLTLLDDLRALTRAEDARLSVAAHQIDPLPGLHSVAGLFADHPKWWSQKFFGQVARRVDQIAVMSYDTARPLESTYGGYVAQQTSLALEVTPPTTHLLMGLPFYYESNFSHWGHAETVAAAVRGARLGLSRTDPDRELFGVAPYIDFAATETNWKEYREGWLRPTAS